MNHLTATAAEGFPEPNQDVPLEAGELYLTGVPYLHPACVLPFGDLADSLNTWDRIVLLTGGAVVGFILGVGATMSVVATHGESLSVGIAICAATVLLSAMMNAFFIARTQGLVKQMSVAMSAIRDLHSASIAR